MTGQNCGNDGLERPADAEAVRDEQVERALDCLDNCGELTAHQRAIVERLADRLTDELLGMFDADETAVEDVDTGEGRPAVVLSSD